MSVAKALANIKPLCVEGGTPRIVIDGLEKLGAATDDTAGMQLPKESIAYSNTHGAMGYLIVFQAMLVFKAVSHFGGGQRMMDTRLSVIIDNGTATAHK